MNYQELNESLREIFTQLIADGYKKHKICNASLGAQRAPQFEQLLSGKDLGIKPLQRIIDSLGYELALVPVPKDNMEKLNTVKEFTDDFLVSSKFLMIDNLETENNETRIIPDKFMGFINNLQNEIFNE